MVRFKSIEEEEEFDNYVERLMHKHKVNKDDDVNLKGMLQVVPETMDNWRPKSLAEQKKATPLPGILSNKHYRPPRIHKLEVTFNDLPSLRNHSQYERTFDNSILTTTSKYDTINSFSP